MAKTLVIPQHPGGPLANGADGCFTRWKDGYCSGGGVAQWLNSLGDDSAPYGTTGPMKGPDGHVITNGEVRANWLRGSAHIVAADGVEAELLHHSVSLQRQLHIVNYKLRGVRAALKK